MYNVTELQLHWENKSPVTLAPELHLTEYVLAKMWTNETVVNADLSDLRHGAFGMYVFLIPLLRKSTEYYDSTSNLLFI